LGFRLPLIQREISEHPDLMERNLKFLESCFLHCHEAMRTTNDQDRAHVLSMLTTLLFNFNQSLRGVYRVGPSLRLEEIIKRDEVLEKKIQGSEGEKDTHS
ncbi:hypothetical protein LCGC14_3162380, partial [marine sediment metagenome]